MVVLNPALPEVQQFDELRRYVYKDALLSTILRKSQLYFRDVECTDQIKGKCEASNNELKQALLLAKQVPQLDLRAPLRIKGQSHYIALDALARTGQELEDVLADILEPVE
jgi:hypothetical protein